MKTKTISRSAVFPADADSVWERLTRLKTLQYIARPYATFEPQDCGADAQWTPGAVMNFRFRLFGLLSLGIHRIHVVTFDRSSGTVYTQESNSHVPVWNHTIRLNAPDANSVEYTDEVEIGAGWKTPFVCLWARMFYGHRQRKWIRMLKKAARRNCDE